MDERLRLVRDFAGQPEFRINHTTLLNLGQDWLTNELHTRGIYPDDLGQYTIKGGVVTIPVRRTTE